MPTSNKRTDRIDLRIQPNAKDALLTAASLRHKTVSEFIIDSALSAADEELADRRHFPLDATQWKVFQEALDAPPRKLPRLEKLFQEQGIFD